MSASFVLASLRGSTYRSVRLASSLAAAVPAERRVLVRRGWEGENRGHFEHPVWVFCSCHRRTHSKVLLCRNSFSAAS
jgi:hypothetical protein